MLREGRFEGSMNSDAAKYQASIQEDPRLFSSVIQVNIAHMHMLKENNIVSESNANQIIEALLDLQGEGLDALNMRPELEDIHMAVEEYVRDQVGEEIGGELHTAKSRNDQVVTSIRMVLREEVLEIQEFLADLIENLMKLSEKHIETIMPGYTHLQVAEPTTFAHYLNSYSQALVRDLERLGQTYEQVNRCPLGACALAGTSFPIDRELTSNLLGFTGISENTMDAVSSRDFILQIMSDLAITMSDISNLSEELVLWSTKEFDMVEIPEEFSSTSSIMPQKKNPVVAELARAKSGRTTGNLVGGLNIMKALPKAYNLDLQELTPLLWDSVDQTKETLKVMGKLIGKLKPKPENMRRNAKKGLPTATELANTLVRETELPFRKAHGIVGHLAAQVLEEEKSIEDITLEDLQKASEEVIGEKIEISEDKLIEALNLENCVKRKDVSGGPAPESLVEELSELEKRVESQRDFLKRRTDSLVEASKNLQEILTGD